MGLPTIPDPGDLGGARKCNGGCLAVQVRCLLLVHGLWLNRAWKRLGDARRHCVVWHQEAR